MNLQLLWVQPILTFHTVEEDSSFGLDAPGAVYILLAFTLTLPWRFTSWMVCREE